MFEGGWKSQKAGGDVDVWDGAVDGKSDVFDALADEVVEYGCYG